MSDHEFDNYLALLARLLRLGDKQRDAIAGELRAHLEDRLDDLIARGVPREQAVCQALAEFGDAAGLAAEFVSLSQNRRRRWIMRLTTASVAAIVLLAAGILTFWPGGNAGPGAARVVAQAPATPGETATSGGTATPENQKEISVEEAFSKRREIKFVETPLKDVFDQLSAESGITFWMNMKTLEEAGINIDTPITFEFKRIRLGTFLDLMLQQLELVYVEKDELVVITTRDDALTTMEVRVYDCRDLLTMPTVRLWVPGPTPRGGPPPGDGFVPPDETGLLVPQAGAGGSGANPVRPSSGFVPRESGPGTPAAPGGSFPIPDATPRRVKSDVLPQAVGPPAGPPGTTGRGLFGGEDEGRPSQAGAAEDRRAKQLMNIITTAVNPDSWQEMGGPGTIGEYNGLVVVSQSARTHSKIEKVLDMLREAANLPKSKGPRVVR